MGHDYGQFMTVLRAFWVRRDDIKNFGNPEGMRLEFN